MSHSVRAKIPEEADPAHKTSPTAKSYGFSTALCHHTAHSFWRNPDILPKLDTLLDVLTCCARFCSLALGICMRPMSSDSFLVGQKPTCTRHGDVSTRAPRHSTYVPPGTLLDPLLVPYCARGPPDSTLTP